MASVVGDLPGVVGVGVVAVGVGAAHRLGPRSTCCQSSGMPPSSDADPPPHLSPCKVTMRPQIAFWTLVGANPSDMSTPVDGHERWVETSSGAAGLPRLASAPCSALVR